MPGLDHVNLRTTRLAETVAFYRDVIGLEVRDPPGLDPDLIQWMYDEQGRSIIHVSKTGSMLGEAAAAALDGGSTGAVHHVALDCTGHDAMIATLEANGLPYRINHVAMIDLRQIFVHDPNGLLIELNFRSGQH